MPMIRYYLSTPVALDVGQVAVPGDAGEFVVLDRTEHGYIVEGALWPDRHRERKDIGDEFVLRELTRGAPGAPAAPA